MTRCRTSTPCRWSVSWARPCCSTRAPAPRHAAPGLGARPGGDRLGPGIVLLAVTGWSRHWGSPAYLEHPFPVPELSRRIVDLGVRTVGIDALSVDATPADEATAFPATRSCAGRTPSSPRTSPRSSRLLAPRSPGSRSRSACCRCGSSAATAPPSAPSPPSGADAPRGGPVAPPASPPPPSAPAAGRRVAARRPVHPWDGRRPGAYRSTPATVGEPDRRVSRG